MHAKEADISLEIWSFDSGTSHVFDFHGVPDDVVYGPCAWLAYVVTVLHVVLSFDYKPGRYEYQFRSG